MLSRILVPMDISKWFRRKKLTHEELRDEAESKARAAEELRRPSRTRSGHVSRVGCRRAPTAAAASS
jgi:hypothetical protein